MDRLLSKNPFDVTFLLGPEKFTIQAHKMILAGCSEVFKAMFYGDFLNEDKVEVTDIEKGAFKTMIDFIYGRPIDIKSGNVANIMCAADKYNIIHLISICLDFVAKSININSALNIFNDFMQYNDASVNDKCLAFIFNDPLRYLKEDTFISFKPDTVKMIVQQKQMNCSAFDVQQLLLAWLKHHKLTEATTFDENVQLVAEKHLKITKLDLVDPILSTNMQCCLAAYEFCKINATEFTIEVPKTYINVFGVGVLCGNKNNLIEEKIHIKLIYGTSVCKDFTKTVKKVYPFNVPTVQNIFFEKTAIPIGDLTVSVTFITKDITRAVYNLSQPDVDELKLISYVIYDKKSV